MTIFEDYLHTKNRFEDEVVKKVNEIKKLHHDIFLENQVEMGYKELKKEDVILSNDETTIMVTIKESQEIIGMSNKYFLNDDWKQKKIPQFTEEAIQFRIQLDRQSKTTIEREKNILQELVKKYPLDTKQLLTLL